MLYRIMITGLLLMGLSSAIAHPGKLDEQGGHKDRQQGLYHCHRTPCADVHQQVQKATTEAYEEGRAFSTLYKRSDWKHWSDADGNCMNTRHEMLKAQADGPITLSPDGCYVSKGFWVDPFSGKSFSRASDLDVDHIIPLKWAHSHGGASWSAREKERFANDPENLLVVDDALNQQKGAQGPASWMPPNHGFRCDYLHMWAKLLAKYPALQMSNKELRVFAQQQRACLTADQRYP